MTSGGELGDFLRAARSRVAPAAAGLAEGLSSRRVTGLRREEVAVLAGVSVDYLARLEQGRERHPSPQVVTALGRALQLDDAARSHLQRLAGWGSDVPSASGEVSPELSALLASFPAAAAYVLGPAFDVLAVNVIAAELLSPFGDERNMVVIVFTHPSAQTVFVDWRELRRATVHALRLNATRFPDDARILSVVRDLTAASPEFAELWASQQVAALTRAFKVFTHPRAGRVELNYQTFDAVDSPGQQLLVGIPAAGSASEAALRALDS
jgi:transcriptional regulator with XRE-family HTH domain